MLQAFPVAGTSTRMPEDETSHTYDVVDAYGNGSHSGGNHRRQPKAAAPLGTLSGVAGV
jgi:hypothetical protein